MPGAIARKRIQPEQVRDRAAPRAHRPAHRHRREEPRGGRGARPGRRRRRSGPARRSSCRTAACSRRRSTTGSAPTSRSSRRAGSRSASGAQVDVVAVAAVQEEIGLLRRARRGVRARPAASRSRSTSRRRPTTRAATRDAPARSSSAMGAMIARGPTLNKQRHRAARRGRRGGGHPARLRDLLADARSTDADEIHLARAGVPTGLLSIPTRYLHSPNEICDLDDVEAIIRLIVAFARASAPRRVVRALMAARSVIVSAVRTPFGKLGGGLAAYEATELGAIAIKAALDRIGIEPHEPQYVIMGQVLQAGAGQAPARQAAIGAGPADGDAGRHDQQGVRVVDPRDRDRRLDDPRGRRRRRRHRRHGVDDERAVPACRRRGSATASATAS